MEKVLAEDVKILDVPFTEQTALITVNQLPIIEEQLAQVKQVIDSRTEVARQLKCTEDNRKDIKELRANLNKEKKILQAKYKEALDEVLAPVNIVQAKFKECISGYDIADKELKKQIDVIETALKDNKRVEVETFFAEYSASKNIDFLTFADLDITVNLSSSVPSLKKQVTAFVERVATDLKMIELQEDKDEILVEYKKSLNAAEAITKVKVRKQSVENERKRRIQAQEAEERRKQAEKKVEQIVDEQQTEIKAPQAPLQPPTTSNMPMQSVNENVPADEVQDTTLSKFTGNFPISVWAHSRDEAMEKFKVIKPKLVAVVEKEEGFSYGK